MSAHHHDNLHTERDYLTGVLAEIALQYQAALDNTKNFRKVLGETQREMWEEVSAAPNDIENMDELVQARSYVEELKIQNMQYKSTELQSKRLYLMLSNPYFARIDFTEVGIGLEKQKIYIGITSLADQNGDYFIYDWRAPISGMFYDFEVGPARYVCLDGTIEGHLTLKRQYRINAGKLDFMFESSIAIDDEILQEILGHASGSRMKNIVATIQREQNQAIRDENHTYLLVSGPAGSGKTSVALHRVAWLLYKHKETIRPQNILVISPNDIFNDYISSVLPSLGEENMRQMTFKQVMARMIGSDFVLGDFAEQIDFIMSEKNSKLLKSRAEAISFKTSSDFRTIICEYIEILETDPFEFNDIFFKGSKVVSKKEQQRIYRFDYSFMPVKKRIEKVLQRVKKLVGVHMEKRLAAIVQELLYKGEIIDRRDLQRRAYAIVQNEFSDLIASLDETFKFDTIEAYLRLFRDFSVLKAVAASAKVTILNDLEMLCDYTISHLENGFIPYEDLAPIVLLKTMAGDIKNTSEIKHVVIDEGQDYTPIQLECITKMFGSAGITILGDPRQSINPYSVFREFSEFKDVLKDGKTAEIMLSKSYRSTLQIMRFCSKVIDLPEDVDNINREGVLPEVIEVVSPKIVKAGLEIDAQIIDIVKRIEFAESEGFHSIAVVCMNSAEAFSIHRMLKLFTPVKLVTKDDVEFVAGPCVIPIYLAKGLEFDEVFLYDISSDTMPDNSYDKMLYTASSRAMHRLVAYYSGEVSPVMLSVPKELYKSSKI